MHKGYSDRNLMNISNLDVLRQILRHLSKVEACSVGVSLRLDKTFIEEFGFSKLSVDTVARHGFLNLLDAIYNDRPDALAVTVNAINDVCQAGHIHILRYLYSSRVGIQYTFKAMDTATRADQVEVLQWFRDSFEKPKYSPHVIEIAASRGNLAAMKWWLNSKLPVTGQIAFLKKAMKGRNLPALKLWLDSDVLPKPATINLEGTYDTNILDIWRDVVRDGKVKSDIGAAFDTAARAGKVHVLDWFMNSGIAFEQYSDTVYFVSQEGHVATLQWYLEYNLLYQVDPAILQLAKQVATDSAIVHWWQQRDMMALSSTVPPRPHFRCRFLKLDEKHERLIVNKKNVVILK